METISETMFFAREGVGKSIAVIFASSCTPILCVVEVASTLGSVVYVVVTALGKNVYPEGTFEEMLLSKLCARAFLRTVLACDFSAFETIGITPLAPPVIECFDFPYILFAKLVFARPGTEKNDDLMLYLLPGSDAYTATVMVPGTTPCPAGIVTGFLR